MAILVSLAVAGENVLTGNWLISVLPHIICADVLDSSDSVRRSLSTALHYNFTVFVHPNSLSHTNWYWSTLDLQWQPIAMQLLFHSSHVLSPAPSLSPLPGGAVCPGWGGGGGGGGGWSWWQCPQQVPVVRSSPCHSSHSWAWSCRASHPATLWSWYALTTSGSSGSCWLVLCMFVIPTSKQSAVGTLQPSLDSCYVGLKNCLHIESKIWKSGK